MPVSLPAPLPLSAPAPALPSGVHRGFGGPQRLSQSRPHTECVLLSPRGFQEIRGTICDLIFSFQIFLYLRLHSYFFFILHACSVDDYEQFVLLRIF
jgi:hypothetical protein